MVFRGSFLTYELDAEGRDTPIFVYSQSRTAAAGGQRGPAELGARLRDHAGGRRVTAGRIRSRTPAEGAPRKRGRFRLASPLWALPAVFFLLAFLIVPLAANLIRSVTLGEAAQQPWVYYQKLLFDAYYSGIFLNTFKVSLITTVCTLIVGYPVAYFMVRYAGRWNGADPVLPDRAAADLDHHAHLRLARAAGAPRPAQCLAHRLGRDRPADRHR